MDRELRRTRFVCISDTHNASPEDGAFKLPKGDVLIHAGDLTKQGTFAELKRTLDWIEKADFEVKLIVAGNHDITLDQDFYAEHGAYFHNQHPQDTEACIQLVQGCKSIKFLNHESADVQLVREGGPRTSFRVFGSPLSPRRGLWAFGYAPDQAPTLWDQIPLNSDVVITHTPPKYHCDESNTRVAMGCEALRQTMWRVRPSLLICGHVHEGRGAQRVLWDLSSPNVRFRENATSIWEDTNHNTKKQSLFDLSRRGPEPLQNTGTVDYVAEDAQRELLKSASGVGGVTEAHSQRFDSAVRGQGGTAPSGRCDKEALYGRMGRQETCVINAAIMASSWPYKANAGHKYNKPIVIDIDLPVRKYHGQDGSEVANYFHDPRVTDLAPCTLNDGRSSLPD